MRDVRVLPVPAHQNKQSNPTLPCFLKYRVQTHPLLDTPPIARVTTWANDISVTQSWCPPPMRTTQTPANLPTPDRSALGDEMLPPCLDHARSRAAPGAGATSLLRPPAPGQECGSTSTPLRLQNRYRKRCFGDTRPWDSWEKPGRNGFQRCWAPNGFLKLPKLDPADV